MTEIDWTPIFGHVVTGPATPTRKEIIMAASHDTVEQIYLIIKRHVSDDQLEAIIDELLQVPGNKSFRETIRRLAGRRLFDDHG